MLVCYAVLAAEPGHALLALIRLSDWSDARVVIFVALSMFIAALLKAVGRLNDLVEGFRALGCRVALTAVPAVIGLLPMPGGALVSAMALRDLYVGVGLKPYMMVFINYWFRHIWVPVWPLFQSILITAAVFEVDPLVVVSATWPASVLAAIVGLTLSLPALLRIRCGRSGGIVSGIRRLATSLWPFAVIALLAATPLGLLGSLLVAATTVVLAYRPSSEQLGYALRFMVNPRVHAIVVESLYMKELLIATEAHHVLNKLAWLPAPVVVFMLPFVLGLVAGGENFFAATAMPILKSLIAGSAGVNSPLLMLAFAGGFLGVMASPVHLCLALTVEYFRAGMSRPLLLAILASLLTALAVFMLYTLVA
jgi:integral membrane protein (TIGR00529 family)